MGKNFMNRRQFIGNAGVSAGLAGLAAGYSVAPRSVLGANDRIGVGFIGVGIRGIFLVEATQRIAGAEVRACCDLYEGRLERIGELNIPDVQLTGAYEEVLDNKDVDAVVIAVPDHWHRKTVLDSLSAGKDVYIEKPMTLRWQDAKEFENAVDESGRILQVGSQQASNPANHKAKELIESGALGKVTYLHGAFHRNTPTGAWYYPVPLDASEKTIDWKRFVGDTEWYDYDPYRFFQWRLFWDYSGGLATDLFVHIVTAAHTVMDVQMPRRVTGIGGQFVWTEHRDVPDHLTGVAEYDEGFILSLNATANNAHDYPLLTIYGTEGTVGIYEFPSRCIYSPEPVREGYWYSTYCWPKGKRAEWAKANRVDPMTMRPLDSPKGGKPEEFTFIGNPMDLHLESFFDAVRSRKRPFEDVVFGGQAANVGHMVNISYKHGKSVSWDREKRQVIV